MAVVLELYHLKVSPGGSTAYFDAQLQLLRKAFRKENNLPELTYAIMHKIKELGLGYERIDACKNYCLLYRHSNKDLEDCPICKESRWKEPKMHDENQKCMMICVK